MQSIKKNRTGNCSHQNPSRLGAMVVIATVAIVLLICMAILSVDVSFMQLTRTELQVAADSAAKAGSEALLRTQDPAAAKQAAIDVAALNRVAGRPLILTENDIQLGSSMQQPDGSWEFTADAQPYNAVRVDAFMSDENDNGSVPFFMASFLGHDSFSPRKTATAANMQQDLYLVIDRSHSMCFDLTGVDWSYPPGTPQFPHPICFPPHPTHSRWGVLRKSLNDYLDIAQQASPKPQVGLITWGSDIGTSTTEFRLTGETSPAVVLDSLFTQNYGGIRSQINGRSLRVMLGGTHMSAGMDAGIVELLKGRPLSRKTMILMTDGQWNRGEDPVDVAERAKTAGITIHTVTFLPGADQTTMVEVAEITGGRHYHADNAAELEAAFQELARSLPVVLTD
ncbi:MAG: VWA domain-containing protein [Planctomycetaceae bacterium]